MEPVGVQLKAAREKKNVPLEQIAQATRINLTYLRNLEEGQYVNMPGGIYNRAFLRSYCEHLGLDAKEYLERYEAEMAPTTEKVYKHKPKDSGRGGADLAPHPLVIWGTMLMVSVVGLYFSRHWIASVFSPYFSHSPASRIIAPDTAQVAPPAVQPASPAGGLPDEPVQAGAQAAAQAQQSPPPAPSGYASPLPATDPAGGILQEGALRLQFEVVQTCWISVAADGQHVFSRQLVPGEVRSFAAARQFFVVLGNAGGVHLKLNGQSLRILGKLGEVVRVTINEQNLPELLEKSSG